MSLLDLPLTIFDIHPVCNQTCSYCVSGSSPLNDFGPIEQAETLKNVETFFESHGPFNVLFTGGEPLITPGISEIFQMLLEQGHRISLQSNLKSRVETFVDTVPVDRTGWVLTSFHSVELKRFQNYLKNVLQVKEKGYPLVVKLVLDDALLADFTRVYDTLLDHELPVILSPVIEFPPGGISWPQQYTPEQWALIAPRMSLLSSWLYFAGGFKSSGMTCLSGSLMSLIRSADGAIHGCGHSFPVDVGNINQNKFSPPKGPISCGLPQCVCDFHYYTGLIPEVDDSRQFKKLLDGQMEAIPFADYLAWMEKIGVEPVVDLRPEMEGRPRKVLISNENIIHIPVDQVGVYGADPSPRSKVLSYYDVLRREGMRSTMNKAANKIMSSTRSIVD